MNFQTHKTDTGTIIPVSYTHLSTAQNMIKHFKETVKIYQQGKEYYDALKSVHNLVKDARKVQKSILLIRCV